ncbi:MAG: hypothetical protein WCB04_12845 [Mycobacteriales bacterium]
MSYFACRAAPLGAASKELVTATFYGYHPDMVAEAIPAVWNLAHPDLLIVARLSGADIALRRLLGERCESPEMEEAAELARVAAESAFTAGRPLAAANSSLRWPAEPHLVLWLASTILRESRGDAHVACLVARDIRPCESHVMLYASGGPSADMLRAERGWSEREWASAANRLTARGWLNETGMVNSTGLAIHHDVEARTDDLSAAPWRALGQYSTGRLYELAAGFARVVVRGGGMPVPNALGLDPGL